MNLEFTDSLVIAVYFFAVIAIGFHSKHRKSISNNSKFDFLLDGRRLTLPLFVATLVATWYGLILGVGEYVYSQGIVAWVCLGLPYYITAILYAKFIAGKVQLSTAVSIPEQIRNNYGNVSGRFASGLVLILTIPAAYILMLGTLIQMFTGLNITVSILIGTVSSVIYLFIGGFRADVLTNALQFVLMYIGFGALFIFSVVKFGNIVTLATGLPTTHLNFRGGNNWQIIIAWFIISLQTFIDPSFHQRSAAAKSPLVAKKGIFISVLFWILFDFLTISTGLYARVHIKTEPLLAFPMLASEILPVFWKGIFAVSLLATVMSSLNSYAFLSAITIGKEFISPIFKNKKTDAFFIRFGLAIISLIGIMLALLLPSAVQLIYKSASIAVPGLLIPLLESYSTKKVLSSKQAMLMMGISSLLSLLWMILTVVVILPIAIQNTIISIEPMIPGIILSFIMYIVIFIKSKFSISLVLK